MGRLIFHAYSCYSCNDSKLYIYDFAGKNLTLLNSNWSIINAMNAHFSPDAKSIAFMGVSTGSNNWDVFTWSVGSAAQPTNLTSKFAATRDEDPKFSSSGNKIVFKQNGRMKEMDTLGNILRSFTVAQSEASMPYYVSGDAAILYSGNEATGNTADIYKMDLATNSQQPLSALPGVEEYYPITRDDTSFLFTRWYSAINKNDQVYMGYFNGRVFKRLPFNEVDQNYSDAYPVGSKYVVLSSTCAGGKGGYDLYLANLETGKKWSLGLYNAAINSVNNELGACYTDK
jgi:Tol biopolymer transport system component